MQLIRQNQGIKTIEERIKRNGRNNHISGIKSMDTHMNSQNCKF